MGETLHSRLLFSLNGEIHKDKQALFEAANDAVDGHPVDKLIVLATCLVVSEQFPELLDGSTQEGSICTKEDGWVLIARDNRGYSVWLHREWDELALQENFYPE